MASPSTPLGEEEAIRVVARVRPVLGASASKICVAVPAAGTLTVGGQTFAFDAAAPSSATQVGVAVV